MIFFNHKLSEVQSSKIGKGTTIWQFVVVLKDAVIGENCNINSHVFIENDVIIGNNVTIKSGVQIWDGVTLEDDVFIGPNVTFTNDLLPRSKKYPKSFSKTIIRKGASIGANVTIIAGNNIGEKAMIGAGAVVTKDVGENELWVGNPAKKIGYVSCMGDILDLDFKDKKGNKFTRKNEQLIKIIQND
ncbi:dTDP-6-deoxy-3,4-keto-hexulose isomerase [Polaribacter sejongensis]|uniref:dTDP-6-deoxy-3,4-keto-hexulose isomerase n=1 Tax=Polaribacter sejongensis TaxID=985043 RepID=A0ABN5F467_9FLAO|nr:acyltransferase [Polaribacter sejongensis]AUC22213.1 dTDP-6-deoxy-3,4-keto-hexulose isomerase [Polaribacter sejongensis]